jgi:ABC-type nitrate/sulfonate/bicarbonate transport system substrate-binding protein
VEFALSEPIHALPWQVQDRPVVSVGQLFELQQSSVMARADRVSTAEDFLGKRLGYPTAPGPNGPEILRQVAAAQGIELDNKAVQKVKIGDDLVGALARDQADVVLVTAQHSVLLAQQQGLATTLFSTESAGIPSFGHNVLVTREAIIQENPERVHGLVGAIAKGTQDVQSDPDYARTLAQQSIQFPAATGEAFLQQTLSVLTPTLRQPNDLWESVLTWMQNSGLLSLRASPKQRLFTNEFALLH